MGEPSQPQIGRIIAKAWAAETVKTRLIADPVATLKAKGMAVPEDTTLLVLEDTPLATKRSPPIWVSADQLVHAAKRTPRRGNPLFLHPRHTPERLT